MTRPPGGAPLTVLMLPDVANSTGNPYIGLLVDELEREGVRITPFRVRAVLAERVDLIHLHWPEASLGIRDPWKAVFRTCRLLAALVAARVRGLPVVWTAHNLRSHEHPHPRLERFFWWSFPRLLTGWLSLTTAGVDEARRALPELGRRPFWVTRHGHYRDSYPALGSGPAAADAERPEPGLLHIGQLRAYKNVPALVRAFGETTLAARLTVAGACHPASLAEDIVRAAAGDDRVSLRLERIDDAGLVDLLRHADLVVLTYRETFNSGTALLALSFDRPVLLPRTPVYEELRADVGADWVHLYDGEVRPEVLTEAVDAVARSARPSGAGRAPALGAGYDWPSIGQDTVAAYHAVLAGSRGGRLRPWRR